MREYKATIDRIIDGDTVDFIVDLGFHTSIKIRGRFKGVDTPEKGHPDWHHATHTCSQLLDDQLFGVDGDRAGYITIRTEKTGKFGRWLVEIEGVTDRLAEIWPYGESR
jgi:micrococcal nuclease